MPHNEGYDGVFNPDEPHQSNESFREEKIKLEELYRPPRNIQNFIYDVYTKLIRWRSSREQPYKQFNGQNLTSYIDEARQKFWGYTPLDFDADTPQFFFPETRNQIIAILAKIANLRIKPSFEGVEGFDIVKATLLRDLFDYWRRGANRKIANFWQFLYNVINGTVIVHTAYKSKKRKVRNITLHDPDTGVSEYTEKELDESDVEDTICNLEDIYVPKIWQPDINKQGELIWRTLLSWNDFKAIYRNYENYSFVRPGRLFSDASIFADFLSYDVRGGDFVEVIKYFAGGENATQDAYAIIANGVLLNPIKVGDSEQEIAPLPWNHKQMPFSKTIFEPIDVNFFYGMPLAMKVKSPQDAINMLWELLLEREIRSVSAPIITNDPSVELGLEFKPGRVYQVQGDVDKYKELQVGGASASYWNALTALQGIINKTGSGGGGPISLPSRQPRSATENQQIAQEKRESAGLYFLFYQDLLEQKVWLTLKNIIQFYSASKVEKAIGTRKFNKIISLTDVKLASGGIGNREIRITEEPASSKELKKESYLRSLLKKERVEIIEVTPAMLQDLSFDLKISFEVENSPETERALFIDFIVMITKLFGNTGLFSAKKAFYRTVEKFNESISDFVEDNVIADYENERFGLAKPAIQGNLSLGELPTVNNFNQSLRGQQFGAEARTLPTNESGEMIMQKF